MSPNAPGTEPPILRSAWQLHAELPLGILQFTGMRKRQSRGDRILEWANG